MSIQYTPEKIKELAAAGYFEHVPQAACMAIMPFVKPEHVGVEIGVFRGDSSVVFLDSCAFMYFIDPCLEYPENPDTGWFAIEEDFLKTVGSYAGHFTFIKGFSADAANKIPLVDFVFIDANHEYEFVKQDIELYWPKVKSGGFLCGHDYSGGHPGVTKAVDEFFREAGLPVEEHQYCWLVHKP